MQLLPQTPPRSSSSPFASTNLTDPCYSLSFTQGLLLGQLSVVLLIGAFIKFFIFGDPPSPNLTSSRHAHKRSASLHNIGSSPKRQSLLRHRASTILRPSSTLATNTASILRKTYYNASSHSHQPESLDWFNVLIAQTISEYRASFNSDSSAILSSLTSALNDPAKKPSFLDDIAVTEISIGDEFPIFSNCRVISIDEDGGSGRLQALMDVDLADNLTLGIETKLLLNYPKPFSAVLPLALAVSVVRFSGTLSVSFLPSTPVPPPDATSDSPPVASPPKTSLAFSFLPDYRLELSVRSLVGSRSRLQDVPKIAQLVEWQVQQWFEERVVEPRVQVVGVPGIWPRMRNTNMRSEGDGSSGRPDEETSKDRESNEDIQGLKLRKNAHVMADDDHPTPAGLEMPGSMPGMLAT